MNRTFIRVALLGALAVGGISFGASTASAQNCIGAGGGTDCPLTPGVPLDYQPYVPNPGRQDVDPGWRNPGWDGHHHRRWRNGWNHRDRDYVYIDRYVPSPNYYYDDDYYEPRSRPRYRVLDLTEEHIDWCYDHYKTYRHSDNTYKKTKTRRVQCISPFS